jgi:large subunit ribosomal protein L30
MPKKKSAGKKLRITYTKSSIGYARDQKGTVVALGLKHVGESAELADSPVVRGMVAKVSHLVKVEEIEG